MLPLQDAIKILLPVSLDSVLSNCISIGGTIKVETISEYLNRVVPSLRRKGVPITIIVESGIVNTEDFESFQSTCTYKRYWFKTSIANNAFVIIEEPTYTYVAYASDNIGTDFTLINNPALPYMAILISDIKLSNPVASNFIGLWRTFSQVRSDWNATTGVKAIDNKPTIPAAQQQVDWNASSGITSIANKPTIPSVDNTIKVSIDFTDIAALVFVYNCPVNLKFTSQESEGVDATISPVLNTNMNQYDKITITASEVGLIVLNGITL